MSSLPASIKRIGSKTTKKRWRHHNMSIENLIRPQGHVTPKWLIRSSRNSNSSEILWLLYASMKIIGSKTTEKRWRHRFPYYKSMGAFCCHRNQSFKPICPKTLCNLSPTLMMLHIKFDQHWPTGLRDIQVSSELWQNSGETRQIRYSGAIIILLLSSNTHLICFTHIG